MQKAFCLVGILASGEPVAKAAATLAPLIEAAKAARISGKLDGKDVKTVFVLASEAVGPVLKYRCGRAEQAPVAEPKKAKK